MPTKSFIVRLPKETTADQVDAAAQKAEAKGWKVTNKYKATIKGFSVEKEVADGEVSAQEVELQSIEAGAEVEADQTVTTQ